MNEMDLQLARAMVDLELEENTPKKTAITKMHDKQQTFRYACWQFVLSFKSCFIETNGHFIDLTVSIDWKKDR